MNILEQINKLTFADIELNTPLTQEDACSIEKFINENFSNYSFTIATNDFTTDIKLVENDEHNNIHLQLKQTVLGLTVSLQVNEVWASDENLFDFDYYDVLTELYYYINRTIGEIT